MINEAVKKQFLSSADYFKARRWEGKPWSFKWRYAVANYPELTLASFVIFLIMPGVAAYRYYSYDTSKYKALEKYRMHYTVVRDDHPNLEAIIKEKEYGRQFLPK